MNIGVKCSKCGIHPNGVASNGSLRCNQCGRFGEEPDEYCAKHDIHYKGLYPDDNHCPQCREERRIQEMERERMTRDPMVEPY